MPQQYMNTITSDIYFERFMPHQVEGKKEFQKKLDEARKVIFTKDDLIFWFYKIKEDAVREIEHLMLKHKASFPSNDKDIKFEKIGFLTGIYEEAERFLQLRMAIEPIDKRMPYYEVLDKLEAIDDEFIKNDELEGFYDVQINPVIHRGKYQLRDLRKGWLENIEKHKDSPYNGKDFGNPKYVFDQYTTEFVWELTKIKPLADIKSYLDYHYRKFSKSKSLFLDHIEFRILNKVEDFTRTNFRLYERLINEWLREKRFDISKEESELLFNGVKLSALSFLDSLNAYSIATTENKYNIIFKNLLQSHFSHKNWIVKDQSMGGAVMDNDEGIAFRDLIISKSSGESISAVECLRIKSIPASENTDRIIKDHLTKIFRNEPVGYSPLFIISYCETKEYENTWRKYLEYIKTIDFGNFQQVAIQEFTELTAEPVFANLRIAKVEHLRSSKTVEVYHFFINMNP